jgi:hypothetical protein
VPLHLRKCIANTHTSHDIRWGCLIDHNHVVFFFGQICVVAAKVVTVHREIFTKFCVQAKYENIFWESFFYIFGYMIQLYIEIFGSVFF